MLLVQTVPFRRQGDITLAKSVFSGITAAQLGNATRASLCLLVRCGSLFSLDKALTTKSCSLPTVSCSCSQMRQSQRPQLMRSSTENICLVVSRSGVLMEMWDGNEDNGLLLPVPLWKSRGGQT